MAVKHRVPGARIIMAKAMAYVVTGAAILAVYVALVLLLNFIFLDSVSGFSWAIGIVAVLSMVPLVKPVLERVQKVADVAFRRNRYDYFRALKNFGRYASDLTDLRSLALTVEQALILSTGAEDVRLLVPSGSGLKFTSVSERPSKFARTLQFEAASPIVTWLRFHEEPLTHEQLRPEHGYLPLSPHEVAVLEDTRTRLLVGVQHQDELVGILVLAAKHSGQPYSKEDRTLLHAAAGQTAMWVSNARLFADATSQRTRLEQLLDRAVWAREAERKRLAMELHDSPVQWLTSAVYRVEACLGFFRKGDEQNARMELDEVQSVLNRTLEELRHTASALHPQELEKVGVVKALARHADTFERDTGILTRYRVHGKVPRLRAEVELAAYRVVQEALSNVRKHSRATEVRLDVGLHNGALWATVRDNGIGFEVDETSVSRNGHLGLGSMEERAHMLGGTLGIQSAADVGTQITLLIPQGETIDVFGEEAEDVTATGDRFMRGAEVMD